MTDSPRMSGMRWLTDEAREGGPDAWVQSVAAYADHLAKVASRLPESVAALANNPRLDLHDGRFEEVTVDLKGHRVVMIIAHRDRDDSDRLITLTFGRATVVPNNLQLLADAVGAEFRANHWHQRKAVTEVLAQEVDVLPDGRFVLRLRLTPFYEFAVEFTSLAVTEGPKAERARARGGRFILKSSA